MSNDDSSVCRASPTPWKSFNVCFNRSSLRCPRENAWIICNRLAFTCLGGSYRGGRHDMCYGVKTHWSHSKEVSTVRRWSSRALGQHDLLFHKVAASLRFFFPLFLTVTEMFSHATRSTSHRDRCPPSLSRVGRLPIQPPSPTVPTCHGRHTTLWTLYLLNYSFMWVLQHEEFITEIDLVRWLLHVKAQHFVERRASIAWVDHGSLLISRKGL